MGKIDLGKAPAIPDAHTVKELEEFGKKDLDPQLQTAIDGKLGAKIQGKLGAEAGKLLGEHQKLDGSESNIVSQAYAKTELANKEAMEKQEAELNKSQQEIDKERSAIAKEQKSETQALEAEIKSHASSEDGTI